MLELISDAPKNAWKSVTPNFACAHSLWKMNQSSDWPKWRCTLWIYDFPAFVWPNVNSDGPTNGLWICQWYFSCRLWLAPQPDDSQEPQEIGYITTLPETTDGESADPDSRLAVFKSGMFNSRVIMPCYTGYKEMMDKLNKFLKKKPLPGTENIF